jgi:uronate dehydrogenase
MRQSPIRTVVMTGAAGRVARRIRPLLADAWPRLVLSDRLDPADLRQHETFVPADLADLAAMEQVLAGADGLIHLGGHAVEGAWEAIHEANIVGLYNTFEAARRQGVKRIVFASSSHAVGFYRRDARFDDRVRPRPDTRYAVSKLFGEALGSLYARKYGIRVLSIRIGSIAERPVTCRRLAKWLHPEDLVQLVHIGLTHPDVVDDVVYGISACERAWWDNSRARVLGYRPRHRAEDHRDAALAADATLVPDPAVDRFQGGDYCAVEFNGGLD